MNSERAIRRTVTRLQRAPGRRFRIPPIVRVTGPDIDISIGDPDQPYWIASIDKVFIATLIAQLFDDGLATPDAPIGGLLPASTIESLPAMPGVDNARDVTVQHLLSHTAGLHDVMLPPRGHETDCSIAALQANPGRVWTVGEFLQEAQKLPAFARPGERFRYSDTGYLLLIRIIEEARGTGFGSQLRDRIFDVCDMADSAAWVDADADALAALLPGLAPFWLGKSERDDRAAFVANLTSHGMGSPSTANDLVRFQRKLHAGDLCDQRWVRLFGTPRSRFRPGIHYGTGMVALRFAELVPLLRGYPEPVGGLGYTATHMFYYPEQRTHVVLNYHAHRRMRASFQAHIRIARLIKNAGDATGLAHDLAGTAEIDDQS